MRKVLLILIILGICLSLTAQEENPDSSSQLKERSLKISIQTASFYQLAAMCLQEGLSTKGSKEELTQRLYDYYGLEAPKEKPPSEEVQTIDIESATETSYFDIERIDENYIRIRGKVRLRMEDREENTIHRIKADEILFNQENNTFTARGNVEYELKRETSTEQFIGKSLSFSLDTWEGFFIEGTTERPREVGGKTIDFRYSGDYMSRSPDDVVVLEDGAITSSESDPPNYHITAKKIWVLAPGEWGIQDAVLHVGRVPVFYFPFFFRPADELVFHPVIGDRIREGNFIQTTTYLFGRKKAEESPFSFLQVTEEDPGEYRMEREGLFLRKTKKKRSEDPRDWFLKAMIDIYTRLGAFTGIQGDFSFSPVLNNLAFTFGIAISRAIYPKYGPPFRAYYINPSGETKVIWNDSNFAGLALPFRYSLLFDLGLQSNYFSLITNFDLYSDPYFRKDFLNRSENIDWKRLFGLESDFENSGGTQVSSLDWNISASLSPDMSVSSPGLSTLRVNQAALSLKWQKREIDDALLAEEISTAHQSPESAFFYPDLITHPSLSMSLGGTILSLPFLEEEDVNKEQKGPEDISEEDRMLEPKVPWEEGEDREIKEEEEDSNFKLIPIFSSLAEHQPLTPLSFNLGYSVNPSLTLETRTDSSEWELPKDISFESEYSSINTRNSLNLNYNLSVYDMLFSAGGSLGFQAQLREVFNPSPKLETNEWLDLKGAAYGYSSLSVNNNLTLTSRPLYQNPVLGNSSLQYSISTVLFSRSFQELDPYNNPIYANELIEWSPSYISRHSAELSIKAYLINAEQVLRLQAELPPLDPLLSASLRLILGPLTTGLTLRTLYEDPYWEFEPVQGFASVAFGDWFLLREDLVYDDEKQTITSSSSTLELGPLEAGFNASYSRAFDFQGPGIGWVETGAYILRPSTTNIGLNFTHQSEPLWRNRITWGLSVGSSFQMNLLRFTESSLIFSLGFSLEIHKFLSLSFNSQSANDLVYQYFPGLAARVGRPWRNPLEDIVKSFNFFNPTDREESIFNVQRISVSAVHHLEDWDLSIEYSGRPSLKSEVGGIPEYIWESTVSISLVWIPIPEIERSINIDNEELEY